MWWGWIRRRDDASPSEWMIERTPSGGTRRYRWLYGGTVKEYEPIVLTAKHGAIPQSDLEALNRAAKEAQNKNKE